MKNKLLLVLASVLATGLTRVQAQTAMAAAPAAAPSSSWVVTPAFASQYMFRGARLGGPSFQPAVEFDSGPIAAGIWANVPMADKVPGQSDPEFDFYGSYTIESIKDTLTWVPGVTIYTYPDADKSAGFYKLTFEPNLALNYTLPGGLKLTPKIYYDFVLKGATYEFNAAYALPLKGLGTELDFTGTIGTFKWKDALENSSPTAKNWGDYYSVGVALPFQVTSNSKLTLGWAYTEGRNNYVKIGSTPRVANGAAVARGVVTASYALTF